MNPETTTPKQTPPPTSLPKQNLMSRISDLWIWSKTHKRAVLVAIAIIFLFIIIIFSVFETLRERFFPSKDNQAQNQSDNQNFSASMRINTNKDSYTVNEKVIVTISAHSQEQAVAAFDVLLEFDPEYLSLTTQRKPLLSEYMYFYNSFSESSIQIAAVQQGKDISDQIFTDTALFEFEFTIKKAGTTDISLIYDRQSNNESNLLNSESVDMLSNVYGKRIEIK